MKNFKSFFIVHHNFDEENIQQLKMEVNKKVSAIFLDADKRNLKYLDSIQRIFFSHCEADFLIVYSKDENIFNGLKDIYKNIARFKQCETYKEFCDFIFKGW